MTTLHKEREKCLVCDNINEYTAVGSTSSFGTSDLDARPPEIMRSTINFGIRRCPSCGYCAPRVSQGPQEAKQIVKEPAYLQQINNPSYPELANSFLCWAIIQEATGSYSKAGWASLQAAWICDDAQAEEASSRCRLRAIQFFVRSGTVGTSFAKGIGAEAVILAELSRRNAQFDQVKAICQEALAKNPEELIQQILNFEMVMANLQDKGCHRVDEAVNYMQKR